ncbi:glutamic acid-rich protein-like isoform X3 [Cyprinodon tularosa]|uniref:glutamic acid-rich protein-like isoform X2 n=1 Tax=Cyprinodon tularosa TaxID=77115 RepID=UPI0018E24D29|nr:glutamic acid-rich protein-like isoform X2 [Cyprinodon tularosa]XP_038161836.1 glutamic acid-rich protein-like isoform X3 [Cyprinodon tularosa]
MEGFADLLTDAFSDSSVPSFSTGDLDFENLCFDEKSEEEQAENLTTEAEETQLQEATAEVAALSEGPLADALNMEENAYEEQSDEENSEEDLEGISLSSKTLEGENTSTEGEEEQKEEGAERDEEEDDTLMSIHSSDVCDFKKEDGIIDDEDSEDSDELQDSDTNQEEVDSDEEEDIECRHEKTVESAESEEEEEEEEEEVDGEEDSSESEYENMKTEEENIHTEEKENPHNADPADSGLEFPSISFQNLQDLISEVDGEVYNEKMSDFTGEEHQEAGESFAEYPSDFSSTEYARNPVNAQRASPQPGEGKCLESTVTGSLWTETSEKADYGEEEEFLFSRDMEMNVGKIIGSDETVREEDEKKNDNSLSVTCSDDEDKTSESDSYSSSDEEEPLRRTSDVFSDKSRTLYLEEDTKLEDFKFHSGSNTDDTRNDRYDSADFLRSALSGSDVLETNNFLLEYLQTADNTNSPPSDINQHPEQDGNTYSAVQREEMKVGSPFIHGSIDDSFFFNEETSNFPEDGQEEEEVEEEEEDEYEERRNFEQMKQRIEAFQKFYNDSDDENGREERQIKVQFCAEPLSQVNYYDTDSSDRDSLSTDSDGEEDNSSPVQFDEPQEPEEELKIKPVCDPPIIQHEEKPADIDNSQTCKETRKSLSPVKLIAALGAAAVTGVLMFWLTSDRPEWLRELFLF